MTKKSKTHFFILNLVAPTVDARTTNVQAKHFHAGYSPLVTVHTARVLMTWIFFFLNVLQTIASPAMLRFSNVNTNPNNEFLFSVISKNIWSSSAGHFQPLPTQLFIRKSKRPRTQRSFFFLNLLTSVSHESWSTFNSNRSKTTPISVVGAVGVHRLLCLWYYRIHRDGVNTAIGTFKRNSTGKLLGAVHSRIHCEYIVYIEPAKAQCRLTFFSRRADLTREPAGKCRSRDEPIFCCLRLVREHP